MNTNSGLKNYMPVLPKSTSTSHVVKTVFSIILLVFAVIFAFLTVLVITANNWYQNTWDNLKINEIVYHIMNPMEGTGSDVLAGFIVSCIVPSVIAAAAVLVVLILLRKKMLVSNIVKGGLMVAGLLIISMTAKEFWNTMEIGNYLEQQSEYSSFIDENYVDPTGVDLRFPEKKRNLVYIFLESMENTFADTANGGAFDFNAIPELTALSEENENFSGSTNGLNGGHSMTGATWTMGAMFAQTSGLPLTINIDKNAMSTQESFIPGATTLGDILSEQGYNQTLLLGSDAAFGGRELYFTQHGNYTMRDYKYYTSNGYLPEDYFVWWGYEDKYLFEFAREEVTKLAAEDEPFNLTMLTVDTHFTDGYYCDLCREDFPGDQYSNVMACSSRQTVDFVHWLQQQPFYENTTIVISGDHPTMDKAYCSGIDKSYKRTVYTTVINAPVQPETAEFRRFSTMDMYPTTLAALGVEIPGNRLALGVNLFSSEQTLYEVYDESLFEMGLSSKSELMDKLTEGISDKMANIEPPEYDETTKTITVRMNQILNSDNVIDYIAKVKPDTGGDTMTYVGEKVGEDYVFTIPLSDFGYAETRYTITMYARNTLIANVNLGSTSIMISSAGVVTDEERERAGHFEITTSPYNYETGTFEVNVSHVPDKYIGVTLAVWQAADQSDLKWYETNQTGATQFNAEINALEYASLNDRFVIHAYGTLYNGEQEYIDGITVHLIE